MYRALLDNSSTNLIYKNEGKESKTNFLLVSFIKGEVKYLISQ